MKRVEQAVRPETAAFCRALAYFGSLPIEVPVHPPFGADAFVQWMELEDARRLRAGQTRLVAADSGSRHPVEHDLPAKSPARTSWVGQIPTKRGRLPLFHQSMSAFHRPPRPTVANALVLGLHCVQRTGHLDRDCSPLPELGLEGRILGYPLWIRELAYGRLYVYMSHISPRA